jgi:hypothetical protein
MPFAFQVMLSFLRSHSFGPFNTAFPLSRSSPFAGIIDDNDRNDDALHE